MEFEKLSRYLALEIPIIDNFNSVSELIFRKSEYFLSSFFFAYAHQIYQTKNLSQLKDLITYYETIYLSKIQEYGQKEQYSKSLTFLKKLSVGWTKKQFKFEQIKEKRDEMGTVVKVVLFSFLASLLDILKKTKENMEIRKDLKSRMNKLLKDENVDLDLAWFMFLSGAFKVNIEVYSEDKPNGKPKKFKIPKSKEQQIILNLAFLVDKRNRLRVLSREDVDFQDYKQDISNLETRILILEKDLAGYHTKNGILQRNYNSITKIQDYTLKVSTLLMQNFENLVGDLEEWKQEPAKPIKFKFEERSEMISKLNYVSRIENELGIIHKFTKEENSDPADDLKDSIRKVSKKLNNLFHPEEGEEEVQDDVHSMKSLGRKLMGDTQNDNQIRNSAARFEFLNQKILERNEKLVNRKTDIEEINDENGGFDNLVKDEEIKKPDFECPVCFTSVLDHEVFTFDCGHKFCRECVKLQLITKFDAGQWGFEIQCFEGTCSYNMNGCNSVPLLVELIGKERVDKMSEKAALDMATNQCANCKFAFMLDADNQIKNFHCENCDAWTCLTCGELKHEEKLCKKKWKEMALALKDDRLRCCPVCYEIYLKDDHCEHVTCFKCKTDFCYNCSAPRAPTLTHGGHYHRRGCKYFFRYMDPKTKKELLEDEIHPRCQDCQKNGKPCPRPQDDLKTFYAKMGLELENEVNPHDNDFDFN